MSTSKHFANNCYSQARQFWHNWTNIVCNSCKTRTLFFKLKGQPHALPSNSKVTNILVPLKSNISYWTKRTWTVQIPQNSPTLFSQLDKEKSLVLFWLRDVWRHVGVLRWLKVGTPPVAYCVLDDPFLLNTVLPTKCLQRGKCRHAHLVQSSKYNLHTRTYETKPKRCFTEKQRQWWRERGKIRMCLKTTGGQSLAKKSRHVKTQFRPKLE